MSLPVIKWSKCYCEDLGTQDEQGFYDYAYCYFVYEFDEGLGSKIVVRRYTDEPDKCHLFVYADGANFPLKEVISTKVQFVAAVINFLQEIEKASKFTYFSMGNGYMPFDTNSLKSNSHLFRFVQVTSEK